MENSVADMVQIRPANEPDTTPGTVARELFESHFKAFGFVMVDNDNEPVKDTAKKTATKSEGGAA